MITQSTTYANFAEVADALDRLSLQFTVKGMPEPAAAIRALAAQQRALATATDIPPMPRAELAAEVADTIMTILQATGSDVAYELAFSYFQRLRGEEHQ